MSISMVDSKDELELRQFISDELGMTLEDLACHYEQYLGLPNTEITTLSGERTELPLINKDRTKFEFSKDENDDVYYKVTTNGFVLKDKENRQAIGYIPAQMEVSYKLDKNSKRWVLQNIKTNSTLLEDVLLAKSEKEHPLSLLQRIEMASYLALPSDYGLHKHKKDNKNPTNNVAYDKTTLSANNVNANKVSISYDNSPNDFPFDTYEAYRIRMISFANGAIYAIQHDSELTEQEKYQKITAIKQLIKSKEAALEQYKALSVTDPDFSADLYQFYEKELPEKAGLKAKSIALAESMYVWQHVPRPIRSTKYERPVVADEGEPPKFDAQGNTLEYTLIIEQIETPIISELTFQQKQMLLTIHGENPPKWFKKLDAWAQEALTEIVPKRFTGDWSNYKKCHPTVLRQIPGEVNATMHELIVKRRCVAISPEGKKTTLEEVVVSHTRARRQGNPSSFNMKDKAEREASATDNLQQMWDHDIHDAMKAFEDGWGVKPSQELRLPFFSGGLLTPADQGKGMQATVIDPRGGKESNTRMDKEKKLALNQVKKEIKLGDNNKKQTDAVELISLNVPLNGHRKVVEPDAYFIQFARKFHTKMSDRVRSQNGDPKQNGRLEKLKQLKSVVDELESLKQGLETGEIKPEKGENPNLYVAALYDVATRLMGHSTGHCKSSKDRKGVEEIMADAMLIYMIEQKTLGNSYRVPSFTDGNPDRARFVEIFCQLYASGHQLLVAHDNSPGSSGIKDEKILEPDMIAKLKEMGNTYAQSKQLADFNKPGTKYQKYRAYYRAGAFLGIAILAAAAVVLTAGVALPLLGVAGGISLGVTAAAATTAGIATTVGASVGAAVAVGGTLDVTRRLARAEYNNAVELGNTFDVQRDAFEAASPKEPSKLVSSEPPTIVPVQQTQEPSQEPAPAPATLSTVAQLLSGTLPPSAAVSPDVRSVELKVSGDLQAKLIAGIKDKKHDGLDNAMRELCAHAATHFDNELDLETEDSFKVRKKLILEAVEQYVEDLGLEEQEYGSDYSPEAIRHMFETTLKENAINNSALDDRIKESTVTAPEEDRLQEFDNNEEGPSVKAGASSRSFGGL